MLPLSIIIGLDRRIIQVGWDLRRPLLQPPDQSRFSYGIRQIAQGFILLDVENQGRRLHSLCGHPAPLLGCLYKQKTFLYIRSEPLFFSIYAHCLSSSYHASL